MQKRFKGLRGWRERHGLKLEEVGDLLGFSSSYLSRVERGQRRLGALDRVRIARVLGARLGDLNHWGPRTARSFTTLTSGGLRRASHAESADGSIGGRDETPASACRERG